MNRSTLFAAVAVLTGVAALSACEGETLCDYVPATEPTGDLVVDIRGCWQAPGIYSLGQDPYREVVYQFYGTEVEPGSNLYPWREVQSPNSLYAGGSVFRYVYSVQQQPDGGGVELAGLADGGTIIAAVHGDVDLGGVVGEQGIPPAVAKLTSTSLLLVYHYGDAAKTPVFNFAHPFRRAVCRGFGFEKAEDACPATAPGAQQ